MGQHRLNFINTVVGLLANEDRKAAVSCKKHLHIKHKNTPLQHLFSIPTGKAKASDNNLNWESWSSFGKCNIAPWYLSNVFTSQITHSYPCIYENGHWHTYHPSRLLINLNDSDFPFSGSLSNSHTWPFPPSFKITTSFSAFQFCCYFIFLIFIYSSGKESFGVFPEKTWTHSHHTHTPSMVYS